MEASNQLCTELIPKYKDFNQLDKESFKGYKLVCKKNLNYYSIVTGMFRYKSGKIGPASYSGLYERYEEHFQEHLKNRLAICTTPEDAHKMLCSYNETHPDVELVVLEIEISGELETATAYNSVCEDIPVVIGNTIGRIKELKSVNL
jgi:hypothetical protein